MRIIHVLRKPLSESTVAANTLKHGTGGLNIDASRIASDGSHTVHGKVRRGDTNLMADRTSIGDAPGMFAPGTTFTPTNHAGGRWPANVILQHLDGCRCDGVKKVKPSNGSGIAYEPAPKAREHMIYGDGRTLGRTLGFVDGGGTETVTNWICEPGCPVARLDEQSGVITGVVRQPTGKAVYPTEGTAMNWNSNSVIDNTVRGFGDTGGASRFYKQVGGGKVPE